MRKKIPGQTAVAGKSRYVIVPSSCQTFTVHTAYGIHFYGLSLFLKPEAVDLQRPAIFCYGRHHVGRRTVRDMDIYI